MSSVRSGPRRDLEGSHERNASSWRNSYPGRSSWYQTVTVMHAGNMRVFNSLQHITSLATDQSGLCLQGQLGTHCGTTAESSITAGYRRQDRNCRLEPRQHRHGCHFHSPAMELAFLRSTLLMFFVKSYVYLYMVQIGGSATRRRVP